MEDRLLYEPPISGGLHTQAVDTYQGNNKPVQAHMNLNTLH